MYSFLVLVQNARPAGLVLRTQVSVPLTDAPETRVSTVPVKYTCMEAWLSKVKHIALKP